MKKQIITLVSAGVLLCGICASAFAAETAYPETGTAYDMSEEVGVSVSENDEVGVNYPVITDFENTATGIRVYWKAYSGAARYGLFYLGEDGWHGIATTSALNMEYENLQNETAYTFTVRAIDKNGDLYMVSINNGQYVDSYSASDLEKTW